MDNLPYISYIAGFVALFFAFTLFCVKSFSKQKQALAKIDASLQKQTEANFQLNLVVKELKKTNKLLAIMGDIPLDSLVDELPMETQVNSNDIAPNSKLYVGNIDYTATEDELAHYFSRFGRIEFVNIPVNRYSGKTRGFGFITFSSEREAEKAISLNGSEFKGRQIQVNFAKERETA